MKKGYWWVIAIIAIPVVYLAIKLGFGLIGWVFSHFWTLVVVGILGYLVYRNWEKIQKLLHRG